MTMEFTSLFGLIPDLLRVFSYDVRLKIIGDPFDENRAQKVLENRPEYIVIENASKKRFPKSDLEVQFLINGKDTIRHVQNVEYLNPGEKTSILFRINWLMESKPNLFEKTTQEDTTVTTPIEPMKIVVKLFLRIHGFLEIQKDEYYMEFGSFKNYMRFQDHPVILLWNKRGNTYVYKG